MLERLSAHAPSKSLHVICDAPGDALQEPQFCTYVLDDVHAADLSLVQRSLCPASKASPAQKENLLSLPLPGKACRAA